jgi:long-chain acyl-CoA synthetase
VSGFWDIAGRAPDRVAVRNVDGSVATNGELLAASRSIASGLAAMGLRPGDGIAAVLPNHSSFFEVYLAAMESGLYFTPVSTHLQAGEISHVITDSRPGALIVHESLAAVAGAAAEAAGYDRGRRFVVGEAPGFRPIGELTGGTIDQAERVPGMTMMYTSGTTGKPKGVRKKRPEGDPAVTFGRIAELTAQGFGITPESGVHLVCGPLYHAGPFVGASTAVHLGHEIVLMDRWEAEACLRLIGTHQVTHTQMVPTMFHRLLKVPDRERYDVASVESVFHTGAPCPPDIKQQMMDWWGPVVYETYGGTESVATIATPRRWLQKPGTVGRPIIGVTVHILDDDGNEQPVGTPGDIYVETAGVTPPEYFNDPEKTAGMRRGTWVTLGDIGYLDEDGFLFLCDRKIDMVISGGVNIYPAEVEAALLNHAAVADAAVIGLPDEEWGEQVVAVVERAEGSNVDAEELIEHCRSLIAALKCPRKVVFVSDLPRLPNGKVEKRRLKEDGWLENAS